MKKIYIAGKVTGELLHQVTAKFGEAQKQWEARGYTVINPLAVTAAAFEKAEDEDEDEVKDEGKVEAEGKVEVEALRQAQGCSVDDRWLRMPWQVAMRLTVAAMMQADEIYMLRCWRTSPGARIEHTLAEHLQYKIHYQ